MTENKIASIIVDTAVNIHKDLGPGLLESFYEEILVKELRTKDLLVEQQVKLDSYWQGDLLDQQYRADLVIGKKVIIEVKSVRRVTELHQKQLLTYLKITNLHLGLVLNFNGFLMKDGIHRVVNNLEESPGVNNPKCVTN